MSRSRLHGDGYGATFLGEGGYTGYRLLRIERSHIFPDMEWAIVKERHQRHGYTRIFRMTIRKWESLMDQAVELEGGVR